MNTIPKIIHQIWLGSKPPPKDWMKTWKEKHPEWDYILWTEDNIPFKKLVNRDLLTEAEELDNKYACICDIVRLEILYRCGGFYIDADIICLKNMEKYVDLKADFITTYEFNCNDSNEYMKKIRHDAVKYWGCMTDEINCNCFIASKKGSKTVKNMILQVQKFGKQKDKLTWLETGPPMHTNICLENKANENIQMLDSYTVSPFHNTGTKCTAKQFKKSFAIHVWGSSYFTEGEKTNDKISKYSTEFYKIFDINKYIKCLVRDNYCNINNIKK